MHSNIKGKGERDREKGWCNCGPTFCLNNVCVDQDKLTEISSYKN